MSKEADIVVPYILLDTDDGKSKALFGVPKETASTMIQFPVMCCGGCFYLQIDEESQGEGETTFIAAIFESLEPEKSRAPSNTIGFFEGYSSAISWSKLFKLFALASISNILLSFFKIISKF